MSLYAKLFIDGFSKPAYVVATGRIAGWPPIDLLTEAFRRLVERHPLARSKVERSLFGVPVRFRHHSAAAWLEEGSFRVRSGFDLSELDAFERELLSSKLDPGERFPLQVWLLLGEAFRRPASALVAKAHHAIADAHTGREMVADFMAICGELAGGPPARPRIRAPNVRRGARELLRDGVRWVRTARLSARIPDVSLLAAFAPDRPVDQLPVAFSELRLPFSAYERFCAGARAAALTFAQAMCVCLLRAMASYNAEQASAAQPAPEELGLMVAMSERWRRKEPAEVKGFAADTRLLTVPVSDLGPSRGRALHAAVRDALALQRGGHNDVVLGLLYLTRRLEALSGRRGGVPGPVREVHLTFSDLTARATRVLLPAAPPPELRVESVRYLVSPVAPAHGGLVAQICSDELVLVLLHHEGALSPRVLFERLRSEMERFIEGSLP